MARKHKRSQQRKPQRRAFNPPSSSLPGGIRPVATGEGAVAPPAPVRRRAPISALPPQDASIPLDRVPYFRADLRRIAVTAALMFALLIAGSFFIR